MSKIFVTRVAFYISVLENKKQIFIIENRSIVYQNILHEDQYTFKPIQLLFQSLTLQLIFERTHWVSNQDYTANNLPIRRLE